MRMSPNAQTSAETPNDAAPVSANGANHVVVMVEDHQGARAELKLALKLKGFQVFDTDNGRDAARQARETHPDLLVVDMDVPLLYGLVAARQIVKHAQIGPIPVVVITHEDLVDPAPIIELGARRNEYVMRLSDYESLQHLLDYLLPGLPATADAGPERMPFLTSDEATRPPLLAVTAPALRLRRDAYPYEPESVPA